MTSEFLQWRLEFEFLTIGVMRTTELLLEFGSLDDSTILSAMKSSQLDINARTFSLPAF